MNYDATVCGVADLPRRELPAESAVSGDAVWKNFGSEDLTGNLMTCTRELIQTKDAPFMGNPAGTFATRFITAQMTLAAVLLLAGCSDSTPKGRSETVASDRKQQAQDDCRDRLRAAVLRFSPIPFSTQTRPEDVVNSINSWIVECAREQAASLKISDANAALLSDDMLRTAGAPRFSRNDVEYLRDCLMFRGLSGAAWTMTQPDSVESATDASRVTDLFRTIIRSLALSPAAQETLPTGVYESLLSGTGSVDDRIWAFAEALRQRQIDCVLLQAADEGDATADPVTGSTRLICVVVGESTLLFDPELGTPVPAMEDTSAVVTTPASLAVLRGHSRWEQAEIQIVAHPSAFAPRMLVLQERLEASDAAVLYEELAGGTSEIRPLLERLRDAVTAPWSTDKISIWAVPEQRITAAATRTESQDQAYADRMLSMQSPFERERIDISRYINDPSIDPSQLSDEQLGELQNEALNEMLQNSDTLYGKPSGRLLKARVSQISGNFELGMIQELQQIHLLCSRKEIELIFQQSGQKLVGRLPLPEKILSVQLSALGDTLFWTALTQVFRGDAGTAIQTMRNYRRRYPDEKMVLASMLIEAELLISLGNADQAATLLNGIDSVGAAEQRRIDWMLTRLPATAAVDDPATNAAETEAAAETDAASDQSDVDQPQ
jgi:hypothetical protein